MPQNHARSLRERAPLSRRQKWAAGLSGAVIIAAVTLLIVLSGGSKDQPGCISTFVPGVIGSQSIHACGAEARQTCDTLKGSVQYGSVGILLMEKACRAGHLAVH